MDISPEDSELGWRLSMDRRSDPPAHLKTSFDLKNAFQSARAKCYSGRKEKDVKIEISNLKSISKMLSQSPRQVQSFTTTSISGARQPIRINYRTLGSNIRMIYFETDDESDDEPQLPICDVLDIIDGLFPAMDFHQYLGALHHQGMLYLAIAVNFDCDFYVSDIGMSKGAASLFCGQVSKMKMKNDRAVARRKAKGKKCGRISHDDRDKENNSS
ncbi:hypothetical protein EV424DRAFT_1544503 [Suillus variegatus]|nr:hypothetical protein EV424DRAFT_1546431 [Suillus variegatus]KAG1805168.1 hypothetical protein EV424DRAFT_1544503 [Suillus variegatus]